MPRCREYYYYTPVQNWPTPSFIMFIHSFLGLIDSIRYTERYILKEHENVVNSIILRLDEYNTKGLITIANRIFVSCYPSLIYEVILKPRISASCPSLQYKLQNKLINFSLARQHRGLPTPNVHIVWYYYYAYYP